MKKHVLAITAMFAMALLMVSCGQSAEKKPSEAKKADATEKVVESNQVIVYYFHSKQRCKTCLAIQEVTDMTVKESFADNGNVIFEEIDYSEAANEKLADKYEIAMSSLIIAKGEKYENLTEAAFANALRNPEVLKTTIIETVNKLLNE